jgi:hypothetical protein
LQARQSSGPEKQVKSQKAKVKRQKCGSYWVCALGSQIHAEPGSFKAETLLTSAF